MSSYEREPWQNWAGKKLLHIGYWPQYMPWQKDWIHFDPEAIVSDLTDSGIEVLEWGVPENFPPLTAGNWRRHPALEELDYDPYERLIDACHRQGIKILFWGPTNAMLEGDMEFFERHRDTLIKQGLPPDKPIYRNFNLCVHNPVFLQAHLDFLRAVAQRYAIDGFAFDGPWPSFPQNEKTGELRCGYCRESFAQYSGSDQPPKEDWNDPHWRKYIQWRYNSVGSFLKAQYDAVKSVDERLYVTENSQTFPEHSYRMPYGNPNDIHRCIDGPFCECPINSYWFLATTMLVKYQRASAGGRIGGIYHKTMDTPFLSLEHGFSQGKPSYVDAASVAYLSLAHGAWVSFHSTMDDRGQPHRPRTDVCTRVAKEIQPKLPWLTEAAPLPHAVICYHVKTRDYYAGSRPELFFQSFLGAEKAFVESHVQTAYVFDDQLNAQDLSRYKLLVLPNTACMSDRQVDAVRLYVANGGSLLATGETSLYDENDRFRGEFGLADVLGIRFAGVAPIIADINAGRELPNGPMLLRKHAAFAKLDEVLMELAPYPWFTVEAHPEATVLATWAQVKRDTIHACVNLGREITGDTGQPVIVAGHYGKGKVVYIGADLTGQYCLRNIDRTRFLLAGLAEWLGPCPIRYHGPKSVELSALTQPHADNRLVVHLVNYALHNKGQGSMTYQLHLDENKVWRPYSKGLERHSPRTDMDERTAKVVQQWRMPLVMPELYVCDECIPVFDSRLSIAADLVRNRKVYLAPGRDPLATRLNGDYVDVTIPRIDIHCMVAVE